MNIPARFRGFFVILGGVALVNIYWIVESWVHVLFQPHTTMAQHLFTIDAHELWVRIVTFCFMLFFAVTAQLFYNRLQRSNRATADAYAEMDRIFRTAADGMWVVGRDFSIVRINDALLKMIGIAEQEAVGRRCHQVFPGIRCHTDQCPLVRIIGGEELVHHEEEKSLAGGEMLYCVLTANPLRDTGGNVLGMVEDFKDITPRRKLENEREELISELKRSLEQVKTLSGLLPICAWCKKVRDDQGYWNKVETYFRDRSELQFTHSICPDCTTKQFQDLMNDKQLSLFD